MENEVTIRCMREIQAAIDAAFDAAEPGATVVVQVEPGLYVDCED